VKIKKTASETFNLLCEAYGENNLLRAPVFEWCKRFSEGREDVEDDEQPGHLLMMKTDENVEQARTLVRTDCHLGIKIIAEESNMDKEMVRNFKTNLNMKSVCQNGP
jgi:hypothetical protein